MFDVKKDDFPKVPPYDATGCLVSYTPINERESSTYEVIEQWSQISYLGNDSDDDIIHTKIKNDEGKEIHVACDPHQGSQPGRISHFQKEALEGLEKDSWMYVDGNLVLVAGGYWTGVTKENEGDYVLYLNQYDVLKGRSRVTQLVYDENRMKTVTDPQQIAEAEKIKEIALLKEKLPNFNYSGGELALTVADDVEKYYTAIKPELFEQGGLFEMVQEKHSNIPKPEVLLILHYMQAANKKIDETGRRDLPTQGYSFKNPVSEP